MIPNSKKVQNAFIDLPFLILETQFLEVDLYTLTFEKIEIKLRCEKIEKKVIENVINFSS